MDKKQMEEYLQMAEKGALGRMESFISDARHAENAVHTGMTY